MAETNDDERRYDFSLDDLRRDERREAWLNDDSGEVHIDVSRPARGLWVGLAVLAVALVAGAGYGYTVLKRNSAQFARFSGLRDSLSAARQRVSGIENRLNAWEGEQQALVERVQKLDVEFRSGFLQARKQAQVMVAEAEDRWQQELDQRTHDLAVRLAKTEQVQQSDRVRMAKLEQEVASSRQELADFQQAQHQQLAGLSGRQTADHNELASIDHLLQTDQVSFEAEKNQDEEIVPGISLRVTKTDIQYQRFSGYVWFEPDRRTIWIRGQGVELPESP